MPMNYPRVPLPDMPLIVHASLRDVRPMPQTVEYVRAKTQFDKKAAFAIVARCLDRDLLRTIEHDARQAGLDPAKFIVVTPFRKPEEIGAGNALGLAFAAAVAAAWNCRTSTDIQQVARVGRTTMGDEDRFLCQPLYEGPVVRGGNYVLVDDIVTTAGSLAQLYAHIVRGGGTVVCVMALGYGDGRSVPFGPSADALGDLNRVFGPNFKAYWRREFGHGSDCLTFLECRRLVRLGEPPAGAAAGRTDVALQRLRTRFAQAAGGSGA